MTTTIQRGITLPPLPEIDDATRREFLIGAGGLLLLAPYGCGGEESGGSESSGETRTVEHAFGTTEAPVRPERVVVLNLIAFDPVVSLGFTPVVSVGNLVSVHEEQLADVGTVLDAIEPSLEEIAAAEPDLILHAGFEGELFSSGSYEQFSEIAPTVVYEFVSDAKWRDYFRFYAEALSKGEEADDISAEYEARIENLRESLDPPEETRVSVISVETESIRNIREDNTFSDSILDEIGFAETPEVPETLSLELIPDIGADVIFAYTFGGTEAEEQAGQTRLEEVTTSPLWDQNPAVQNDRAFVVGDYWFGFGYTAANAVLDDLERFLLEGNAS